MYAIIVSLFIASFATKENPSDNSDFLLIQENTSNYSFLGTNNKAIIISMICISVVEAVLLIGYLIAVIVGSSGCCKKKDLTDSVDMKSDNKTAQNDNVSVTLDKIPIDPEDHIEIDSSSVTEE